MTMSDQGRAKRSIKNLKLTEKYRMQYLGLWLLITCTLVGMLDIAIYTMYEHLWSSNMSYGTDRITELAHQKTFAVAAIGGATLFFVICAIYLIAFTAHRIGGPYLALKRTMAQIKEGNLGTRLKFREYDKLEDVEKAFNEMMDVIQAKAESSVSGSDSDSEPISLVPIAS